MSGLFWKHAILSSHSQWIIAFIEFTINKHCFIITNYLDNLPEKQGFFGLLAFFSVEMKKSLFSFHELASFLEISCLNKWVLSSTDGNHNPLYMHINCIKQFEIINLHCFYFCKFQFYKIEVNTRESQDHGPSKGRSQGHRISISCRHT